MQKIVIDMMPDHSIGYDVPDLEPGDRYRGMWWRRIVKFGLEALPEVEYRDDGASDEITVALEG